MKFGFFASVPKTPGFRNTFNISPVYQGQAIGPESGCGDILIERYGEFQRFQTGDGISGRDPVELQTTNLYLMVEATNSDTKNWSEGCPDNCRGTYLLPGKRTYCVSYKHLDHYRCQDGEMTPQGKLVGFGENRRGYDLPK